MGTVFITVLWFGTVPSSVPVFVKGTCVGIELESGEWNMLAEYAIGVSRLTAGMFWYDIPGTAAAARQNKVVDNFAMTPFSAFRAISFRAFKLINQELLLEFSVLAMNKESVFSLNGTGC